MEVRKLAPDSNPAATSQGCSGRRAPPWSAAAPTIGADISHESPQEEQVFMYIFYIQIKLTHGIFHPEELK